MKCTRLVSDSCQNAYIAAVATNDQLTASSMFPGGNLFHSPAHSRLFTASHDTPIPHAAGWSAATFSTAEYIQVRFVLMLFVIVVVVVVSFSRRIFS